MFPGLVCGMMNDGIACRLSLQYELGTHQSKNRPPTRLAGVSADSGRNFPPYAVIAVGSVPSLSSYDPPGQPMNPTVIVTAPHVERIGQVVRRGICIGKRRVRAHTTCNLVRLVPFYPYPSGDLASAKNF